VGVDLDDEVLEWARLNNIASLSPEEQQRISLVHDDVVYASVPLADVVLAMNFSYYLFIERAELLDYFRSVHANLADDGIFFLDAYGGYDSPKDIEESRDCEGFTYIWEQSEFNPIDSCMSYIHFEFPDKSRIDQAFTYHWRLWTLPEIREVLDEAGFSMVDVYWEGTDEATNEGDGIFTPATVGDADPGWVCYIVAQR
jgi:cyclopropane fatty-acyl-phospholipid synthase-like methyltransferase